MAIVTFHPFADASSHAASIAACADADVKVKVDLNIDSYAMMFVGFCFGIMDMFPWRKPAVIEMKLNGTNRMVSTIEIDNIIW